MSYRRKSSQARQDSSSILNKVIGNIFKRKPDNDGKCSLEIKHHFKKIASRASVVILSECLDKLSILCIITQEKIDPQWLTPLTYKPLQQKMTAKETGYDLFTYTNKKKLAKDLTFLTKLLSDVIDDILYGGEIVRLTKSLYVYEQETAENEDLLEECASNKALLRKLSYDMRKSSSRNREALNKKADEAYEMHEEYEETLGYGNIEYKYVDKWENSRTFLNNYLNTQAENHHQDIISTYKTKQELENRINKEISDYMDVTMSDMQQQIETWMTKYDDDVERLEKNMFELRVGKEKMELDFADLTKLYAQRQSDIEKWVKFRDTLRQEEEVKKKTVEAAIKIQAWWRGTMVRKHLGPFAKKGKAKGKGNQKGKKGGKGGKKK